MAMVANTLEDLLNVLHESVMEDWFAELDVPEVALAFSRLTTGFALLIHAAHTESEIVGT